jgi:uncharacterized protein (TIGR02186 family)
MGRILALCLVLWTASAAPARAQGGAAFDIPLITDLSAHLIAITSSFSGTDLLLFGSLEEPGDVIVVVRGPAGPLTVRRKERLFGIWVNRTAMEFASVPGYYAVAASRPLADIAPEGLLERLQIGADNLRFSHLGRFSEDDVRPFRTAIVRNKSREGLYHENVTEVAFLGRKLFRTRIDFPAVVPVGTYRAEVYLIRDKKVVAAQAIPLFIDKQGVEQAIYDFAHTMPLFYGLLSVAIAAISGWLAAIAFRKA